ncbi:Hypothetical protein R9X50_00380300 [Acrodontium crateriforme]|uniref:Fork-head domain-containing protein n=1 Tax=Acrodontium crateriforme TaxID=150365 RepID=A0AAQ3M445_9PEZI|nr:Hypothetical protein R9X50_00380300 [Acrodontium crateriforme]
MDSGALTLPATPVPPNAFNHTNNEPQLMGGLEDRASPTQAMFNDFSFPPTTENLDTPIHRPSLNPFEASNLRQYADCQRVPQTPDNNVTVPPVDTSITMGDGLSTLPVDMDASFLQGHPDIYDQYNSKLDNMVIDENDVDQLTQFTEEIEEPDHEPMQAYAKLCLPDGDYFIKNLQVILGRDMEYFKEYLKEKKRAQRAQRALDEYALEPSQPSQPDDGDGHHGPSSKSSQSLVGRPARGLPSHYSEQGGAVSYAAADSDDEFRSKKARRRRRLLNEAASSTASIAPAHLHPNMMAEFAPEDAIIEEPAIERIHVHPKNRADIAKISKDHLLFAYSFDNERWEMHVLGRWAFVNNVLHEKDAVIPLQHGDNIMVTSLSMEFKLPDNSRHSPGVSRGTFAESDLELSELEDEGGLDTSPAARKASGAADDPKRPKLKLKLGKKKAANEKSKDENENKAEVQNIQPIVKEEGEVQSLEKSPEAFKKPAKKPATPAPEATQTAVRQPTDEATAGPQMSPPVIPTNIEPGSIFEGVAAEELPQKRKGPGRPPKNGLISKRDQSFVKRKLKEYEKRGENPPPMDELVAIVRAENKAKELAAKAAQRGEAVPDASVVQSIESDLLAGVSKIDPSLLSDSTPATAPTPSEPVRRPSPKPKRVARSPSPMKPESDYTEEELKKPTMTYVHILDEILRDHEDGKADLQEIYDRICKRYPYFKYRVSTAGWQSSVRHNLLQHDRFMENGRSGKGRLWAINHNCPIDKEKKRRITPPPRPPMPAMQNGQFAPGQHGHMSQYGQQNYNAAYGPPGMNRGPQFQPGGPPGQGAYYSPYAPQAGQGGPYGPPPGQQMNQMNQPPGSRPPNAGAPGQHIQQGGPPHGQVPPTQPAQNPPAQHPPFQPFVEEIMIYRSQYLSRFTPGSEVFNAHEELFKKCTSYISELFHGTSASVKDRLESEEEKSVFRHLEVLYERYRHLSQPAGKTQDKTTSGAKTPAPTTGPPPSQPQGQPQNQGPSQAQAPVQSQGQPTAPVQQHNQPQAPPPAQVPSQGAALQPIASGAPFPASNASGPIPPNNIQHPVNGPSMNNTPHPASVIQPSNQPPPPAVQPAVTSFNPTAQEPIVVPDDPEPKTEIPAPHGPSNFSTIPISSIPSNLPVTSASTAAIPAASTPIPPSTTSAEPTGMKRSADESEGSNANCEHEQDAKRIKMS